MSAIPEILIRRNLPEEYHFGQQGRRYLDDEEITIISLLDESGILSETRKLNDFMILLTRLEKKVDHRAVALEILTNYLAPAQSKEFVLFGGFCLLRRWLKEAEEQDSLFEMMAIIKLAAKLPFDSNSIKISEIGKLIKRLQKYQPKNANQYTTIEVNEFLQEVNRIVDSWKEQLQMISKSKKAQAEPATAVAVKTEPKKEAKETISKKDSRAKADDDTDQHLLPVSAASSTESKMDVVEDNASSAASTSFTFPSEANEESKSTEPVIPLPSVMSALPAVKPVVKERKPLGMLEGARKLLAMRSEQAKTAAATATNTTNGTGTDLNKDLLANEVKDPAARNQKPLAKGGLKKKDSSAPKKEKVGIKWADEEGGLLREIYTIEVEKIKSSVANYKTHKDLVKKERQLEKETHLTQVTEAMHRTTEWRLPKPLNLSIQITDNIGIPTGSLEKTLQTERIASVLEVRYLDESLIPNDPDEDYLLGETVATQEMIKFSTITNHPEALANVGIELIPWKIDGQEEEENNNLTAVVMNTVPSSSGSIQPVMGGGVATMSYGMMTNNNNNNLYGTPGMNNPYGYMNTTTSSSNNNSYQQGYSEFDINTFANSLPEKLQALDPFTFQFLIQDQSILSYLILSDGQTVNDAVLNVLKNSHSLEDFYNGLKLLNNTNNTTMNNSNHMMYANNNNNVSNSMSRGRVSRWQQPNTAMTTNPVMANDNRWGMGPGATTGNLTYGPGGAMGGNNTMSVNNNASNWGSATNTIVSSPFISHTTHSLDTNMNNNAMNNSNLGSAWMMSGGSDHSNDDVDYFLAQHLFDVR